MMNIKTVFDIYEKEIRLVEDKLRDSFNSRAPIIPLVGKYLLESGGKRLRPLFLISSARLAGYKGSDHIHLGAIIELIHMSSLLHDDVVDEAQLRRGKPAAHSVWGNQIVILVGDFLYSNALRGAVLFGNQRIMETLSAAATNMTEGEILQLQKTSDIDITEEEYLEIVSAKTGNLISAACRIGAILGNVSRDKEDAIARFGLKSGAAFQVADDILDYMADENELGKRLGKDLEEGKITLPLIYLFRRASEKEKKELKELIENFSKNGMNRIWDMFRQYNVLEESFKMAHKLVDDAKSELLSFPHSMEKEAMLSIADYAILREK